MDSIQSLSVNPLLLPLIGRHQHKTVVDPPLMPQTGTVDVFAAVYHRSGASSVQHGGIVCLFVTPKALTSSVAEAVMPMRHVALASNTQSARTTLNALLKDVFIVFLL